MIEFMPWYTPGESDLVRCGGDEGCGALLVSGDTEMHLRWHKKMEPAILRIPDNTPRAPVRGVW